MSMESLDIDDDVTAGSSGDIDMHQISTMTLDEFRNLLNMQLSVPSVSTTSQNGVASLSSDSPRSQGSGENSRSSRAASATSSWREVREKARSVCQSIETKVGSRTNRPSSSNDSGYLSQNGETPKRSLPNRPKTPTYRPITPVSKTNYDSRSKTPTYSNRPKTPTYSCRPKTPTDPVRSSYQRPGTPVHSNMSSPSTEFKVFDPSPDCTSTPLVSERPSTPSLIPRPSGHSRPSTPTGQMLDEQTDSEAYDNWDRRVAARPTPPARKQLPPRPASAVPRDKPYSSVYQSSRPTTPGTQSKPSELTTSTPTRRGILSRNSAVSRSVTDVRKSLSRTVSEFSDEDAETNGERGRTRSTPANVVARRNRTNSAEPRHLIRQATRGNDSCLVVTRSNGGNHGVTVTSNGSTRYDSNKEPTNKFVRSASSDNCDINRSRHRSRTPDPSMFKNDISRRKSEISIGSGKFVESRTEAWVNSTVSDNKRKLPPKPKRAMTPNSMNRKELELTSRPFEEIKEALRVPMEIGVRVNPAKLNVPPEDPKAYMQMEKLFQMLKAKELRESVNNTVVLAPKRDSRDVNSTPSILKNPESKAASSRSLNSVRFSNSSLSSLSSGNSKSVSSNCTPLRFNSHESSPLNHSQSFTSFNTPTNGHSTLSRPSNGDLSGSEEYLDSDTEETTGNDAQTLASRLKEMAKLRPRKEEMGSTSRIPAPNLSKNKKSKSFSNLSTSFNDSESADKLRRDFSVTSDDSAVFYNPNNCDNAVDKSELLDRAETPVPRMATPLTTGRSTFLSTSRERPAQLVRAVSQDRSRSNSVSSLSSLSLSTAENEHEFV